MQSSKVLLGILFLLILASIPSHSSALTVTITGCSPGSPVASSGTGTVTATSGSTTLTFATSQAFTTPQCILTAGGNFYFIISGSDISWNSSQPAAVNESASFNLLTMSSTTLTTTGIDSSTNLPFVNLGTQSVGDFTVTCVLCPPVFPGFFARAFLDSSGSVVKILMDNMKISVSSTASCSATALCPIQIRAASDSTDNCTLPTQTTATDKCLVFLPAGGYPAGGKMTGRFFPTATNDTVFASAVANGDVVNAIGPGPLDIPVTLPYTIPGCPTCFFTPVDQFHSSIPATDTFISETVQLVCPAGQTTCPPSIAFALNIGLVPGDNFDPRLSGSGVGSTSASDGFSFATPFAAFSAEVQPGDAAVAVESAFTLAKNSSLSFQNAGHRINGSATEIGLTIGPFDTTLSMGTLHLTGSGAYSGQGTQDGINFDVVLKFLGVFSGGTCVSNCNSYTLNIKGNGSPLANLHAPVPFGLTLDGSDRGYTTKTVP